MKCVILAAGEGKRMHPLTYTRPKVMLPVCNKPLLEWNLQNAKNAGITDFLFIISYKSEIIRNHFKDGTLWNVNIEYINQGQPLGTAHAIQTVQPFVETFLVLSGDTIFETKDIQHIINTPQSIGTTTVDNPEDYGIVKTQNNHITKIYEKMLNPFTNLINAGIYHFTKNIFTYIKQTPKSVRGEYEITDSLNLLTKKEPLSYVSLNTWHDVVYPWHLLDITQKMINYHTYKNQGTIHKHSNLNGDVSIGKKTTILPGSYIEGPAIIGENCKIGPNCYIRPYTIIGNNCHIGNACEVKNTIVFNNSNIPHQNYVGDSIIGEGCNLGAGTKIANLRLDKKNITYILNGKKIKSNRRKLGAILGDNVQTGINSSINIGTNIGNNVAIGPSSLIQGEIQPASIIN